MERKLRVAQVGTGHPHGNGQTETILRNPAFELVGYAEPTPDYCHPEHKNFLDPIYPYHKMQRYTVDELLNMDDLDGVVIETQEMIGTEYAQLFAEKGTPIFFDKPGTHGVASFEKFIDTCRKNHVPLYMGYMYRCNPLVQKALSLVKAGELGEIFSVEGQMSLRYDKPMCQWIGNFRGGMMYYLGCHMIDLVLQFMGGLPEKVTAMNACTGQYGFVGENYGFATLQYKNGTSFVKTTCAEVNGFTRRQLVISGEKGTIEIRPMEAFAQGPYCAQTAHALYSHDGKTDVWDTEPFPRYGGMFDAFAHMLYTGEFDPAVYDYELDLFRVLMQCCGAE